MSLINFRGFTLSAYGSKHVAGLGKQSQAVIDSEVLRLSAPLIPLQTGNLIRSGQTGTVIGSGVVKYTASYGREQYYSKQSRPYDSNRGGKWFERMKTAHKSEIIAKVKKGG